MMVLVMEIHRLYLPLKSMVLVLEIHHLCLQPKSSPNIMKIPRRDGATREEGVVCENRAGVAQVARVADMIQVDDGAGATEVTDAHHGEVVSGAVVAATVGVQSVRDERTSEVMSKSLGATRSQCRV